MRGSDGIGASELLSRYKNNSLTHNHHKKSRVFALSELRSQALEYRTGDGWGVCSLRENVYFNASNWIDGSL